MKSIKIAHCADIHVRPNAYMDEIQFTFDRFLESITENNVDLVVICGDFYHNKITVSNEYFSVAYNFFKRLKELVPFIIIPGNHDCVLTNAGRVDAITPIMNSLIDDNDRFKYSKYSESFSPPWQLSNHDINFHHFSILDPKHKWIKKENLDKTKVNICLYHGAINNSKVDSGWISRGNKDDIDIFDGFDFAFLGDIHAQQFLNSKKTIAYPGSIRQNNFGEDIEKGYLLWEIKSKTDFNVERVILPQKRYFFTFYLNSITDLNELGDLPLDCRIRVKSLKSFDLAEELKIKEEIIEKYKPSGDVLFLPPEENISSLNSITKIGNLDIIHENIRNFEVQKELIKEYLQKNNFSTEEIEEVLDLDKKYHSHVDTDVLRDVIFKIKKIEWNNFLSYGKQNEINFENLNGIIGVFGPTGSGKSTLFDIISFILQNSVYREGANKNGEYINRKCKRSDLKMELEFNNSQYIIERKIKKTFLKDKEDPKIENEVDFYTLPKSNNSSLNGETVPETNKLIRDLFGTKDDFEMMSHCSQFGLTSFIDARGTKRKENLAKFFDLNVFDTKFELALKDHKEIKSKLKDGNKIEILKQLDQYKSSFEQLKSKRDELSLDVNVLQEYLKEIDEDLFNLASQQKQIKITTIDVSKHRDKIRELTENLQKHHEEFKEVDHSNLEKIKQDWNSVDKSIEKEIETKRMKLPVLQKQSALLKKIPGEEVCKSCHLVSSAYEAKEKFDLITLELKSDELKLNNYFKIKASYDAMKTIEEINKSIKEAEYEISLFESQREDIEYNKILTSKIADKKKIKQQCQDKIELINREFIKIIAEISSVETKIQLLEEKIKVIEKLGKIDKIYSIYLDAMGKNGISYWIISKKLNLINKITNQILSQAVSFKFSIEDNEEEKSIKIYIIDEKGKRSVELCSGGEKTLVALALRAALWKICLLPKCPILILDESLVFLDAEKYDGAIRLIKYLSQEIFDKVFLVTHNEELKRIVDYSVYIDNKKGFSYCEVK